jgi:hypothetical protein
MSELFYLSHFSLNFLIIFGVAALMQSLSPDRDDIYLIVLVFSGILCLIFLPVLIKLISLPIILKLANVFDRYS